MSILPTKEEVIEKVRALVETRWTGNYQVAFSDYAHDGHIDFDRLKMVLRDADVGNAITRTAIARAAMDVLDTNKDGFVSWDEFNTAMQAQQ